MPEKLQDQKDQDTDVDADIGSDVESRQDLQIAATHDKDDSTGEDSNSDSDIGADDEVLDTTVKVTDEQNKIREAMPDVNGSDTTPLAHKIVLSGATVLVTGMEIVGVGQNLTESFVKAHEVKDPPAVQHHMSASQIAQRQEEQSKYCMIDSPKTASSTPMEEEQQKYAEAFDVIRGKEIKDMQAKAKAAAEQDERDRLRGGFHRKP